MLKQQKKSIAKMWGKGVFKVASLLWFSAICCSLRASVSRRIVRCPRTSNGRRRARSLATARVGRAQGLQLRQLQRSVHCLHVNGQQLGELRRGHDDLHQLVSDGHRHPVRDACGDRCADADLFRPEEDLGSHVRVGPRGVSVT